MPIISQFPTSGDKENPLKTSPIKENISDTDGVVIVDGSDQTTKRVTWGKIDEQNEGKFIKIESGGTAQVGESIGDGPYVIEFTEDETETAADGITFDPTAEIQSDNVQSAIEEVFQKSIPVDQKGVANGVATLGSDGKVPEGQLPEMSGVMYVNITGSGGTYSADKTAQEIYEAYQSGYAVFAELGGPSGEIFPLYASTSDAATFFSTNVATNVNITVTNSEVFVGISDTSASSISFSPTDTLTSDNVQDAIEEVDGKASKTVITQGATTVQTSAWSADTTYEGYGYRASIAMSNVTSNYVPSVTFGITEAESGNFAPVADSYSGGVYIYAKEQPTEAVNVLSISCVRGG